MRKSTVATWLQDIKRKRSIGRFGSAWAQAFLSTVPWLNVIILMVLLFALHNRIAVTPGVIFDLPSAPFLEGTSGGLTVLMLSVPREMVTEEETLVFFDDERYFIRDDDQAQNLASRINESIRNGRHHDILLLADKRVPHGDIMTFTSLACKAGVKRISVAQKPE